MAKARGERAPLVGAAVLGAPDLSALTVRRPIERGYLVNADVQRDIWTYSLTDTLCAGPADSALLLTEPVLNLPSIQEATDQVCQTAQKTFCKVLTSQFASGVRLMLFRAADNHCQGWLTLYWQGKLHAASVEGHQAF